MSETIYSEAIYGMKSRQALVKITLRDQAVVISSDDARQFGKGLIDAAHASDGDAFLVEWITEELGVEIEAAARLLFDFRAHREMKRAEREANR